MEKENKLRLKREATRKRKASARKDMFMIAYVNKKYSLIYKEAESYYNKLNETNPSKIDLRKTKEFRELKQTPPETANDRMVLQIPITSGSKQQQQQPQNIQEQPLPDGGMALQIPIASCSKQQQQPQNIQEQPLPDDLQGIQGIMKDHLPQGLIENMMKELKDDPYISKLMDELETELNNGINLFNDDDDDIEIDDDDRLEEELMW